MTTGLSRFDELYFKTDRQLIQLIRNELDTGARAARQALIFVDDWASAERHYRAARRACEEASRLISFVREIPEDERRGMESALGHLREVLETLSAIGSTPAPTEDEIAALAHVLWDARGCPEGLPEEDWFRAERALKSRTESYAGC